ncbi:unnamed protein product, partial [Mesorhabditis spiculigera]
MAMIIKSPQYIYHLKNILQWLNHIFCGLEYLYMQKTVHGDLKPENIFVDKDFVLKLGDFGSLKQLDDSADLHEALQVGTLGYMAPEYSCMVVSELTAEERYKADVYSSGIVLMEIDNRRNHIPNADVVFDFGVPDYLQEILTLTSTAHVNFLASFAQDKWPNLGGDEATGRAANSLMPLVRLDYFIQLHCMISALEAIALCKETRYRLASLDLYKLTTIALTNVEQLDGIFTKRLKLPILLYKQPQDQWYEVVPMKMVFRTDLSAAQPKWPDDHEVRKAQDAPLGQAYPRMQLDRFFWEFRDRLELKLTTEDTQKCKVHNVEEVLQKHREACGEDLMKRYLFFLDEPPMFPCSHEADCPRADAELDDIAFNCLTATTTREHRYAVSQEFIPPEPNSDVPSRRSGIVNHVKKVKNRPCDVLPGYLIQAPTKNDTVLWGLRLGRAPVRAGLDLDLTGVAQLKFSDIRPILETLKDELKDWDDRLLMDERRLGSDFILGNEWRAIRQQEYERRMEEFLEKLEKLASFSAADGLQKQRAITRCIAVSNPR